MGFLSRLFGGGSGGDARVADSLASMIVMSDSLLRIKDKLANPKQEKAVVGFFFGFADFMGQAKGLSQDAIHSTAKSMFKAAFKLGPQDVDRVMKIAAECSRTEEGRRYMQAGAESIATFMAKQSGTPVGRGFMELMAEVGE